MPISTSSSEPIEPDSSASIGNDDPELGNSSSDVQDRILADAASISLFDLFDANEGAMIHKWEHYFPIYERYFSRFVGKCPRVLEIGVSHGGSLAMWSTYFGPGTTVVGIDIDPRCKDFQSANITIFIGDQGDRKFLREMVQKSGPFDIVIDDGGHQMIQQIASLQELLPAVSPFGVYFIEDLHTSYWSEFGGGYQQRGSFIEFAKCLIDELNGFHVRQGLGVTTFTETVQSISFYDSVAVIEKYPKKPLVSRMTGKPSF